MTSSYTHTSSYKQFCSNRQDSRLTSRLCISKSEAAVTLLHLSTFPSIRVGSRRHTPPSIHFSIHTSRKPPSHSSIHPLFHPWIRSVHRPTRNRVILFLT